MSGKVQKKIRRELRQIQEKVFTEITDAKRKQRARVVALVLISALIIFFKCIADMSK